MKAMLLAVAVIVVVIGIFEYVVHTDPNRAQTRDALVVLHENSSGVPRDPAALGYLELKNHEEKFDREYSVDHAMKEAPLGIVQGTLLKQDYLLRQAEYKRTGREAVRSCRCDEEVSKLLGYEIPDGVTAWR